MVLKRKSMNKVKRKQRKTRVKRAKSRVKIQKRKTQKRKTQKRKTQKRINQYGGTITTCMFCSNKYYGEEDAGPRGQGWFDSMNWNARFLGGPGSGDSKNFICPGCFKTEFDRRPIDEKDLEKFIKLESRHGYDLFRAKVEGRSTSVHQSDELVRLREKILPNLDRIPTEYQKRLYEMYKPTQVSTETPPWEYYNREQAKAVETLRSIFGSKEGVSVAQQMAQRRPRPPPPRGE